MPAEAIQSASLIQLIATPERFEGKRVRVVGFFRDEFEGIALYLHREDLEHGLTHNGLWVDLKGAEPQKSRDLSNRYVLIEGTFDPSHHGHMGLWSGAIVAFTRLTAWR